MPIGRRGVAPLNTTLPMAGAVIGALHVTTARVFNADGRSLHPLQRTGAVDHTGYPNIGAPALPHVGSAPVAGGPDLAYPLVLQVGLANANGGAGHRV